MTIPPTRFGRAIRWVESYAGYKNESATLWHLYETGVNGGVQHPAFNNIPVYVNIPASMYCYWDHGEAARRMPWQVESYYTQEHQTLTENEFERIHMNEWVEPVTKAIPIEWWDACESRDLFGSAIPPLDWRTPIVIGADAAISHDCCALVAVSRHPLDKQVPAVRLMRIWQPRKGHPINLSDTMEATLREWIKRYNVVEVTYDKYQLHKLMSDLRGTARTKDFSQGALRAVADKHLYDLIVQRSIAHSGEMELREHVDNAAAKDTGDKYRFCKMDTSTLRGGETAKPIDALVALSMAVYRCMRLNL
jgi:phage terminase large subunit-like protein